MDAFKKWYDKKFGKYNLLERVAKKAWYESRVELAKMAEDAYDAGDFMRWLIETYK
jgi:hypothetical protein